jgi:hypothetical protein
MTGWTLGAISALILVMGITLLHASPPQNGQDNTPAGPKPKVSKEELRRQKALRMEFVNPYGSWLHVLSSQFSVKANNSPCWEAPFLVN